MRRHIRSLYFKGLALFALFSVELLITWLVFFAALFVFLFISKEIFYSKQEAFDQKVFVFLDKYISPSRTRIMEGITFLASRNFIVSACAVIFIYYLFVKKHAWYSLKIPVVALGSISLNLILKNFFQRPRPYWPHMVHSSGLSFPSGHAMVSFSFYGLIIYLVWQNVSDKLLKYFAVFFLLIVIQLIGFSRVYLHVHYASDVLAGFSLGIIWLILSIFILRKIEKYSKQKLDPEIIKK